MQKKRFAKQVGLGTCLLILILDGKTALAGAQDGIDLCLRAVIPALFPFFILSDFLICAVWGNCTPLLQFFGKMFGVPQGAESLLFCSFLGGYPVGAKEISQAYQENRISKADAIRLLSFCNQPGPAFLFGMIAPCLGSQKFAWILWGIILLSAWGVSCLHVPSKSQVVLLDKPAPSIAAVMTRGIRTMSCVCGWVLLFRVVFQFLNRWILWLFPEYLRVALSGILELSSGCAELSRLIDPEWRFILAAIVLSFGGFCVLMQTASVLEDLPIQVYLRGKLLQTVFSGILACTAVYGSFWYLAAACIVCGIIAFRKKGVAFFRKPVYNG